MRKRGFAALGPEQVRELARRGGLAAHRQGNAHEFTSEEARVAGRKGGLATHSRSRGRALDEAPVEKASLINMRTRAETTP
jgi:general stress protein YciG